MDEQEELLAALSKHPELREASETKLIISYLRNLDSLCGYRDSEIESLATCVRLSHYDSGEVVYEVGDTAICWFVVVCGAVCFDDLIHLPHSWFGRAESNTTTRTSRCAAVEPTQLIWVSYTDEHRLIGNTLVRQRAQHHSQPSDATIEASSLAETASTCSFKASHRDGCSSSQSLLRMSWSEARKNAAAHESVDSLQGNFTLLDIDAGSDDDGEGDGGVEVQMSSVSEALTDTCSRTSSAWQTLLQRAPSERCAEDVEMLLTLCSSLAAFKPFGADARRALCRVARLVTIERRETVVLRDGDRLDSWTVLVSGAVHYSVPKDTCSEAEAASETTSIEVGDAIGVILAQHEALACGEDEPELQFAGELRTTVDECEFVCVPLADFVRVLRDGRAKTVSLRDDNGQLVLVREALADGPSVVVRGTSDRLLDCLLEDHSVSDPTFIEDLVLTWRVFLPSPTPLTSRLADWYCHPGMRDRAVRIVLFWVNAQFDDFEMLPELSAFLERFETQLARDGLFGQLALLHLACAAKASRRRVTLRRSDSSSPLPFRLVGGLALHAPIFIAQVTRVDVQSLPVARGDQLLSVNDVSLENVLLERAEQLIRTSGTVVITLKANPIGFYDLLNSTRFRQLHPDLLDSLHLPLVAKSRSHASPSMRTSPAPPLAALPVSTRTDVDRDRRRFIISKLRRSTSSAKSRPTLVEPECTEEDSDTLKRCSNELYAYYRCVAVGTTTASSLAVEQQVVQIHRSADSSRLVPLCRSTTAHEAVMLALQTFGVSDASTGYSLCELAAERAPESVVIRQKRLADSTNDLALRLALNARYFLKPHAHTDTLVPDGHPLVDEMLADARLALLELDAFELAQRVAEVDYELFRAVRPFEYVTSVFPCGAQSDACENLQRFANYSDQLLFWVCSEVLAATSVTMRVRTIKQFVRVACWLRRFGDFFACQALLGGLAHTSVARLAQSWSQVPRKYARALVTLERFRDPTRNFKTYRAELQLARTSNQPCVVWLPIHLSDLTKIKEVCRHNADPRDPLIDFGTLRLVAREVRAIGTLCTWPALRFPPRPTTTSAARAGLESESDSRVHNLTPNTSSGTLKRSNSSARCWKRHFETLRETRRVRAYLEARKIVSDESRLLELSCAAEPPAASGNTQLNSINSSSGNSSAASSFAGSLQSMNASMDRDSLLASVNHRDARLRRTVSSPPPDEPLPVSGPAIVPEDHQSGDLPRPTATQTLLIASPERTPRIMQYAQPQRIHPRYFAALAGSQTPLARRFACPLQSPVRSIVAPNATLLNADRASNRSSICSVLSAVAPEPHGLHCESQPRRSSLPDCRALLIGAACTYANVSADGSSLSPVNASPRVNLAVCGRWPRIIPNSNSTLVANACSIARERCAQRPLPSAAPHIQRTDSSVTGETQNDEEEACGRVIAV